MPLPLPEPAAISVAGSVLSAEQRARIEQNKRRALERRAASANVHVEAAAANVAAVAANAALRDAENAFDAEGEAALREVEQSERFGDHLEAYFECTNQGDCRESRASDSRGIRECTCTRCYASDGMYIVRTMDASGRWTYDLVDDE